MQVDEIVKWQSTDQQDKSRRIQHSDRSVQWQRPLAATHQCLEQTQIDYIAPVAPHCLQTDTGWMLLASCASSVYQGPLKTKASRFLTVEASSSSSNRSLHRRLLSCSGSQIQLGGQLARQVWCASISVQCASYLVFHRPAVFQLSLVVCVT